MYSIYEEITEQIESAVKGAIKSAVSAGEIPEVEIPGIIFEKPREEAFGDLSTNLAMQMARLAKTAPRNLAQTIVKHIKTEGTYISRVEVAGPGFINFYLNNDWLYKTLRLIDERQEHYGEVNIGNGEKVMVEFVSANPTGPLHMGNARGGALGDCIASVLEKAGYNVTREFYVNDAGNQIEKFGISLEARYLQQLMGEDSIPFPEDGYHGEDIIDHVKDYINEYGTGLLDKSPEERRKALVDYALPKNLQRIKDALTRYRISYDVWFRESSLYEGEIEETMNILKERDYVIEKDGALWLSAEKTGLEKDEVLIRQNGYPTYMAADIAYHRNKFIKRGFDRVINLWGADHHGYVNRLRAVAACAGDDPAVSIEILIGQLVKTMRDGKEVKLSKRAGEIVTLTDLVDEVGVDAACGHQRRQRRRVEVHHDWNRRQGQLRDGRKVTFMIWPQPPHARLPHPDRCPAHSA